jgi:molybdenum cofactor biosynthesis enzyme MoaA
MAPGLPVSNSIQNLHPEERFAEISTARRFDFAFRCARMHLTQSGELVLCLRVLQRESFEKRNLPA